MRRFAVAVGAVVVLAVGGVAWAAIPGDNGVAPACYDSKTGAVKVQIEASSCPKGFNALDLISEIRTYSLNGVFTIAPGDRRSFEVQCNDGDIATGGGVRNSRGPLVSTESSTMTNEQPPTGWQGGFRYSSEGDQPTTVGVDVVCLDL